MGYRTVVPLHPRGGGATDGWKHISHPSFPPIPFPPISEGAGGGGEKARSEARRLSTLRSAARWGSLGASDGGGGWEMKRFRLPSIPGSLFRSPVSPSHPPVSRVLPQSRFLVQSHAPSSLTVCFLERPHLPPTAFGVMNHRHPTPSTRQYRFSSPCPCPYVCL